MLQVSYRIHAKTIGTGNYALVDRGGNGDLFGSDARGLHIRYNV
jgi:hypothetical protein